MKIISEKENITYEILSEDTLPCIVVFTVSSTM